MKYKSLLKRLAEKETIIPSSSEEDREVFIPSSGKVPEIKEPDLEERAKKQRIYDERESPFWQEKIRQEQFEEALEAIKDRLYRKDEEEALSKRPTELFIEPSVRDTELFDDLTETTPTEFNMDPSETRNTNFYYKPKSANSSLDKLLKLCDYFYDLSVKEG